MSYPNKNDKCLNDKKIKYNVNTLNRDLDLNTVIDVPGMLPTNKNNQSSNTDVESFLRNSNINSRKKADFILDTDDKNKDKDYRNFGITNISRKVNLNTGYIPTGYKGQGHGFSIKGSDLRYGQDTRQNSKNNTIIEYDDYNFHSTFRNYQNPDNLVMSFPRGGIDTRNLDKYSKN